MPWATATVSGTGGSGTGDVDFYSFSTLGGGALFDIDAPTGFDSILSLFDSTGTLIADNDDAGSEPGTGSGFDSYIGTIALAPGVYYIAVSQFANFATAHSLGGFFSLTRPDSGFGGSLTPGRPVGLSTFGASGADGSATYTLHISLESPGVAVPEPTSLALLSIGGIGMLIGAVRRRRKKLAA